MIRKISSLLSLTCLPIIMISLFPCTAFSKKEHLVYFPNTPYELNIYKTYGKKPGKTLMLIGGIQGNEPGGFLSADLYADMRLEKGNLIVVPRANFYSIILNKRGPNGDMNRMFTHKDISFTKEDKIVSILKKLISESDYLLNLHDGAGYYYPRYISKWRNPMRFGQSVIADCERYHVPGTNKVINLGDMAREVVKRINPHIHNDLYKFHFMNTRTSSSNSRHKEQRKSATYYALTKHHIPAFGIETSKFLPSVDLKVRYHNLAINAFMELFGIIPESPGLVLDPPHLEYLVVSINGQTPIVINGKQSLRLHPGDTIKVTHIEANYERGLSLDILGYGDLNDYRKDFAIYRNTTIIVRKDHHQFAEIPVEISRKRVAREKAIREPDKINYFVIEAHGNRILLSNGETLRLVKGDEMKIVDVLPPPPPGSGIKVNFKGFVGNKKNNTGEDRGYTIHTGTDLIERYSLKKNPDLYEIVVSRPGKIIGRAFVELSRPKLSYLVLKVNTDKHLYMEPGQRVTLSRDDRICPEVIQTNLHACDGLHLSINDRVIRVGEPVRLRELLAHSGPSYCPLTVKKGNIVLGKISLHTD